MAECCFLAIDIAKNVFQLHDAASNGSIVFRRRLMRDQLPEFVAKLPACVIAMEACASAHHWAREFRRFGHDVRLISPQFVRPFVKGSKNDGNDAEAICEAMQRPNMRFVPIKTIEQQDIQSLHRVRSRLVSERTALVCQIRGILAERGIVFAKALTRVRREVPVIAQDLNNPLTPILRTMLTELMDELSALDVRIKRFDHHIDAVFQSNEACQRIARIEGVGPKTATAFVAAIGDPHEFKNGRHFAAWLGLVPRQRSSGDRQLLLGITKRGDKYLRTLLVHGARAVLRTAPKKNDAKHAWALEVASRRGAPKAIVAIANKIARVIWVLLAKKEDYRPAV